MGGQGHAWHGNHGRINGLEDGLSSFLYILLWSNFPGVSPTIPCVLYIESFTGNLFAKLSASLLQHSAFRRSSSMFCSALSCLVILK